MMDRKSFFSLILTFSVYSLAEAKGFETLKVINSENMKIKVELVLKGQGIIWGMDFLDQDRVIFTEREGNLKIYDLKTRSLNMASSSNFR